MKLFMHFLKTNISMLFYDKCFKIFEVAIHAYKILMQNFTILGAQQTVSNLRCVNS